MLGSNSALPRAMPRGERHFRPAESKMHLVSPCCVGKHPAFGGVSLQQPIVNKVGLEIPFRYQKFTTGFTAPQI
jgi:hypothetical protein